MFGYFAIAAGTAICTHFICAWAGFRRPWWAYVVAGFIWPIYWTYVLHVWFESFSKGKT